MARADWPCKSDHHAQTNARVGEQFVQSVFLAGEHAPELLALARNVAHAIGRL